MTSANDTGVRWGLFLALWAAFAVSVAFSFAMRGDGEPGSVLWTGTGILTGGLIMMSARIWPLYMAACAASQFGIGRLLGQSPDFAAIFAVANLLVGWVAAMLALRLCGVRARRLSLTRLARLLVLSIAPSAALGALLAAIAGRTLYHADMLETWGDWMLIGGLGMAIVLPAMLLAVRHRQYREFRRSVLESVALQAGIAALTFAVFFQSRAPLLFMVYPMVTLIAFRLGPAGAAVASGLVGLVALPLTLSGHGPAMLASGFDPAERVRLIQVFVMLCLFTGVASAGALADQARLRRLMIWRDRAARTARVRAKDAERRVDRLGATEPGAETLAARRTAPLA